jgi:hypothetical protein
MRYKAAYKQLALDDLKNGDWQSWRRQPFRQKSVVSIAIFAIIATFMPISPSAQAEASYLNWRLVTTQ